MQKLTTQSELNSPQEYDKIFFERQKKGVDEHDVRRWKRLLKYYKGGYIADLGCLDSGIPNLMSDSEWYPAAKYFGVDLAEKALRRMGEMYPYHNFCVGDLYNVQSNILLLKYDI